MKTSRRVVIAQAHDFQNLAFQVDRRLRDAGRRDMHRRRLRQSDMFEFVFAEGMRERCRVHLLDKIERRHVVDEFAGSPDIRKGILGVAILRAVA